MIQMMIMANEDHHREHCDDQRDDQATTSLIFDVEEAISGSRSLTQVILIDIQLLEKSCPLKRMVSVATEL